MCFNIMAAVTICSDFGAQKIKSDTVSTLSPDSADYLHFCHNSLLYLSLYLHRYADDTTLMAESEEELKSLLMKVKEESEKLA